MLTIVLAQPVWANLLDLTIEFVPATISANPGDTNIALFATIGNITGDEIFLNGDAFTLPSGLVLKADEFFPNAPFSLIGGHTAALTELFKIDVPATTAPGNYTGTYNILGGPGLSDQTLEGSAAFVIKVLGTTPPVDPNPQPNPGNLPEPASAGVLAVGLVALRCVRRGRRSGRVTPD